VILVLRSGGSVAVFSPLPLPLEKFGAGLGCSAVLDFSRGRFACWYCSVKTLPERFPFAKGVGSVT
jgi:hypothetical protein